MNFIIRVDDRLIHGQVTAGWVRPLGIERIVLANDNIADDEWEREIYTLAVPSEIEVKILHIIEVMELMNNAPDNKKTMILINSLQDALRIIETGVQITKLNIGGLHYESGKKAFTTYIFLSDEDIKCAKAIINRGIMIEGREIPGSPSVNIENLINKLQ